MGYLLIFRRVRKIAKINFFFRHVCLSVRPSAWNNSATTARILTKFDLSIFFENLSPRFKFHYNLTRITGTLHEELRTFMKSRSVLLREREMFRTKL